MRAFPSKRTPLLVAMLVPALAGQTSAPARPAGVDAALWERMVAAEAKTRAVSDLTADFEQQKFTAILRKPLVSSGKVLLRGPVMRWDTAKPEPTSLRIDASEVRIYYPEEKTIEAYAVEAKLGALAASPLPRLDVLVKYFGFAPLDVGAMGQTDATRYLALKLTPLAGGELQKYVADVRVVIDATTGHLVRMEMNDTDGDRTVVTFRNVRTNVGLAEKDVALEAPAGVKVVRPLAALEPGAAATPGGK